MDRVFADDRTEASVVDRPAAQIVTSWFRTHSSEVANLLSPDEARHLWRRLRAG
jgi:hypothetical protein